MGKAKTHWLRNPFIVLVTCLAFLYVFFIGIKHVFRYNMFKQEYSRLVETHYAESLKYLAYQSELKAMDQTQYWEFQARRKLGYVKKGEEVYKLNYTFKEWR